MRTVAIFLAVCLAVALAAPITMMKHSEAALAGLNKLSTQEVQNNVWAVLVAGSNGWTNYRHQSDICHAYQTLHKAGVPDERIIVMMYDDIAKNEENPTKGIIINDLNGPDVYKGVPHDYTGNQVTLANFQKVLTGIPTAVGSKKVLASGPNDHVYVFFDDHGNTDIIAFPNGDLMTSKQLLTTLESMHTKKLYGTMVLYVSACLSGSMFYKLTLPPNIYAATSAPVAASAFAINYDSQRQTYLCSGWPYGINKFMDVSTSNLDTFQDQFDWAVLHLENYSLPCQYGEVDWASKNTLTDWFSGNDQHKFVGQRRPIFRDQVPEWDVPYEIARRVHMAQNSENSYKIFSHEQTVRNAIDQMASKIAVAAIGHDAIMPCTTCDNTCPCITECDESDPDECKFECCDERACTMDYQGTSVASRAEEAYQCTKALTKLTQRMCGHVNHPYLAKAEVAIHRICRQRNVNMKAAAKAITSSCNVVTSLF